MHPSPLCLMYFILHFDYDIKREVADTENCEKILPASQYSLPKSHGYLLGQKGLEKSIKVSQNMS